MADVSPADKHFSEKLHRIIQERMSGSEFGVSELAKEMGMSRSTLLRKVRETTGKTANNLISEARLNQAMELLKHGTLTVSEVAWEVGFGSVPYFVKCFHYHFGFTPGDAIHGNVPEIGREDIHGFEMKPLSPGKKIIHILTIGSLIALIVVSGTWFIHQKIQTNRAISQILPQIKMKLEGNDYLTGFELLQRIRKYVPENPEFERLDSMISKYISFHTVPPGAEIFFKAYSDTSDNWRFMGISPVDSLRFPRHTLFMYKLVRQNYEPVFGAEHSGESSFSSYNRRLFLKGTIPDGMVHVDKLGNDTINDYFIDKFEVSNKAYKEFVDHGGYQKRDYWKYPFLKNKDTLSWKEAMTLLTDKTGRPGPSVWEAGSYPEGEEDYPVNGVSWYEAAAYAAFESKELPTLFHWGNPREFEFMRSATVTRSNFQYKGLGKVGFYKGMNSYGAYDMAGNVREWCYNGKEDKRCVLGGAWDDPHYSYWTASLIPAFDRSQKNGFRCVKYIDKEKIPEILFSIQPTDQRRDSNFWHRVIPISDEAFRIVKNQFFFSKTDFKVKHEKKDERSKDWIQESISFNTVYDDKQMVVYLFLPKNTKPPFQTVVMVPGYDGFSEGSNDSYAERTGRNYDFIMKSGRALLLPVYYAALERKNDAPPESYNHQGYIHQIKDFRRSVDYLETRPEIDTAKIAVLGVSFGGLYATVLPAIEERLKAAIIVLSGFGNCPTIEEMDKYQGSEFRPDPFHQTGQNPRSYA